MAVIFRFTEEAWLSAHAQQEKLRVSKLAAGGKSIITKPLVFTKGGTTQHYPPVVPTVPKEK